MATAPKLPKQDYESCEGYLHNVTPINVSRRGFKYFKAVVQEQNTVSDVVCYASEDVRTKMNRYAKDRTPVKFNQITRSPSERFEGKFGVKFNSRSQITAVSRKLDFTFQKLENAPQQMSIENIQQLNPFQKVNVTAKVLTIGETENQPTRSEVLKKSDCVIADSTGSINLTLWENSIPLVSLGKSYKIENLSVRVFDCKLLTSTLETKIIEVEDIGIVKGNIEQKNDNKVNMIIESINCKQITACTACKKSMDNVNKELILVVCPSCNMTQKVAKLSSHFKCELLVTIGNEKKG